MSNLNSYFQVKMNPEKYIFKFISDYSFRNQELYPTLSSTILQARLQLTADATTIGFAMFGY